MNNVLDRLQQIFSSAKRKKYQKGGLLLNGENPEIVFFLEAGQVKQYSLTPHGEEIIHHLYKQHSVFPLAIILSNKNPKHFFEATTETTVATIPAVKFVSLLTENKELLFHLLKNMSNGLIGLTIRIESLLNKEAFYRTVGFLLYLGQKYKKENTRVEIDEELTHQELSGWLGHTRETISRQLERLKKEGLIDYQRKKICIKDLDKLKDRLKELDEKGM